MAIRAILTALALLALAASPALAGGDAGGDTVTKTFELTLNGDVPSEAAFVVGYVEEGQNPEEEGTFVLLCGDTDRLPEDEREEILQDVTIVSDEPCVGGGNAYTYSDEFARGTRLAFFFARASVTDTEFFEIFHTSLEDPEAEPQNPEDYETLHADTTNSAWYTFGGAADDQQDMPEMPDTGAGGMAGAGLPLGPTATALSLVIAGGYAARRRR